LGPTAHLSASRPVKEPLTGPGRNLPDFEPVVASLESPSVE
jgi:hypothetical protein